MDFKENHISVSRTARYFTYGELSESTEHLWFAFHGYGMLARSMVKRMQVLDPNKHFVVAPEGLSRFYWHKPRMPVASWMTSDDRLYEIEDYIRYLNRLYVLILTQTIPASIAKKLTINALSFSQGTNTMARWITDGSSKVHNAVYWAGSFPEDAEWNKVKQVFENINILYVIGKNDPLIPIERQNQALAAVEKAGLSFDKIIFDGGHDVTKKPLLEVAEWADR